MKIALFFITIISTSHLMASSIYMSGTPNRIKQALEQEFGIGSGVGTKAASCILCHTSSAGGSGNIQATGFGRDFQDAAIRLNISGNGGGSLNATGSNSLQSIFAEATFRSQDADGDGLDNEREYELDSDPNDTFVEPTGGGADGGGCGMIMPIDKNNFPGSKLLLLLIPLAVVLFPRKISLQKV